MKKINESWHKKNRMKMPSTLAERVKWHEAHLQNCGCRKDVPPTILAEFKKQGKKVCSRGHIYTGSGPCPICWPGRLKSKTTMNSDIQAYSTKLSGEDKKICDLLRDNINKYLVGAESKVWHGHPVWFLDGNPIVGYSKQKRGLRLMFWSGADFNEAKLEPGTGKFKDASVFYTKMSQVNTADIKRWLEKAKNIQWDYKNIVKRKGKLVRFK